MGINITGDIDYPSEGRQENDGLKAQTLIEKS